MLKAGESHQFNRIRIKGTALDLEEDTRKGDPRPVMISKEIAAPILPDSETEEEE